MSNDAGSPDYDLEDLRIVSSPRELRAMADPLRSTILELLLERAATVSELAAAVGRPRSTVAHHVGLLAAAGMLKVVRTRRVRAIDERYYGRTARIFYVGAVHPDHGHPDHGHPDHGHPDQARLLTNHLAAAAAESGPAHEADDLRAITRHTRIPRERAAEFWERVMELASEFTQLPRSGDTVYGFAAGLYPAEYPTLPPTLAEPDPDART